MNKYKQYVSTVIILFIVAVLVPGDILAFQTEMPNRLLDARQHRNGKLWTWITNFGQFGTDQDGGTYWPGTERVNDPVQYINRGGLFLGGIVPADGTGRHQVGGLEGRCFRTLRMTGR